MNQELSDKIEALAHLARMLGYEVTFQIDQERASVYGSIVKTYLAGETQLGMELTRSDGTKIKVHPDRPEVALELGLKTLMRR